MQASCQEPKIVSNTPAFLLRDICLAKREPGILVISQTLMCVPSNCLYGRQNAEQLVVLLHSICQEPALYNEHDNAVCTSERDPIEQLLMTQ